MIIALHIVGLILCCIIAYYQIQLRRQLGYVVFWTTAISGVIQLLMRWEKYLTNVAAKLYGFCWILFSAIGLFFSVVTWQSAYCETDGYIMRESKGFMGWETAILYKKNVDYKKQNCMVMIQLIQRQLLRQTLSVPLLYMVIYQMEKVAVKKTR